MNVEDTAANILSSLLPVKGAITFGQPTSISTNVNRFDDTIDKERNGESVRSGINHNLVLLRHQCIPGAITQSSFGHEFTESGDAPNQASPAVTIGSTKIQEADYKARSKAAAGSNGVGKLRGVARGWLGRGWFVDETLVCAILFRIARDFSSERR